VHSPVPSTRVQDHPVSHLVEETATNGENQAQEEEPVEIAELVPLGQT
jgi:hypothetical protein